MNRGIKAKIQADLDKIALRLMRGFLNIDEAELMMNDTLKLAIAMYEIPYAKQHELKTMEFRTLLKAIKRLWGEGIK